MLLNASYINVKFTLKVVKLVLLFFAMIDETSLQLSVVKFPLLGCSVIFAVIMQCLRRRLVHGCHLLAAHGYHW